MNELVNNKEKWEILFNHIIGMDYESMILHTEIEQVIDTKRDEKGYYSVINKAKKKLLEANKGLINITGQGYKMIHPDEYVDLSLGYIKRGFKQIGKGYKVIESAPVDGMTKEGLERYRQVSDKTKSFHAMIAGGCTELKLLSRQSKRAVLNEH